MRLTGRQLRGLIREALAGQKLTMDQVEEQYPEAYDALPSSYQADPDALSFRLDTHDNLIADHWQRGVPSSIWNPHTGEWSTKRGR